MKKYKGITVSKRTDNRWVARPTLNGKQLSIYGRTQEICYLKLKDFFDNKDKYLKKIKKQEQQAQNIKLYAWLNKWIRTYKTNLKYNSLKQIEMCIKNHIKPHIKDISLINIKPIDINIALNKIKSSRMKKYAYDTYRDALRQAYKNQLIKLNIAELIEKVTHQRTKGRSLNKNEIEIFLNCTKKIKHGKIFEFMLYSGARPHGSRNAKWEHLKNNMLEIAETKSKNANRHIPLFRKLKTLLCSIEKTSEYIFPISETTIKRAFDKLRALCGFDFTQKDLRHTFATLCAENNINDITIAKWMGHSNISTTKQYYIEVLSDFEKEQANVLNNVFDTKIDYKRSD